MVLVGKGRPACVFLPAASRLGGGRPSLAWARTARAPRRAGASRLRLLAVASPPWLAPGRSSRRSFARLVPLLLRGRLLYRPLTCLLARLAQPGERLGAPLHLARL